MNPKYHTDESITILTHAHILTHIHAAIPVQFSNNRPFTPVIPVIHARKNPRPAGRTPTARRRTENKRTTTD